MSIISAFLEAICKATPQELHEERNDNPCLGSGNVNPISCIRCDHRTTAYDPSLREGSEIIIHAGES